MGLFRKRTSFDVIHVRYMDAASGEIVGQVKLPISKLPQSFEASTIVHRGAEDWQVIEARPVTAEEFRRTGQLLLVVSKIATQSVDPSEILFSLPTIADNLPPIAPGSAKLGIDTVEILEDFWRQIEWVPASVEDVVETELDAIGKVIDEQREGEGFRICHVRSAPTSLAILNIKVDALRAVLGPQATWLAGFSYNGIAGIVANSFAARLLCSIELYGIAKDGIVEHLCVASTRANNIPMPDVQNLADIAANRELLLVDWPSLSVLPPVLDDYKKYFCSDNR